MSAWMLALIAIGPSLMTGAFGFFSARLAYRNGRVDSTSRATNRIIDQLQEDVKQLKEDVTVLKAERSTLQDYAETLRQHISNGQPPPPPEWPVSLRRPGL